MGNQDPWLRAEMGGTKQALVISKPEILIALIKKAKHPLIVIGHETTSSGLKSDILIRLITQLQKISHIPLVSTAHIAGELISRGVTPEAILGSMEITDRLCDPSWNGLDNRGQYDLILIAGFSYTLGALLLSGLKQSASQTKVVSIDPVYHPHATWSFTNMKTDVWGDEIERFIKLLIQQKTTNEVV